jgi:hypothetical protein
MPNRNRPGDSLFAWMTEYPDGTSGLISAVVDLPPVGRANAVLIGRNREAVVEVFGPIAIKHGKVLNQRVWLREFTSFIDHDVAGT